MLAHLKTRIARSINFIRENWNQSLLLLQRNYKKKSATSCQDSLQLCVISLADLIRWSFWQTGAAWAHSRQSEGSGRGRALHQSGCLLTTKALSLILLLPKQYLCQKLIGVVGEFFLGLVRTTEYWQQNSSPENNERSPASKCSKSGGKKWWAMFWYVLFGRRQIGFVESGKIMYFDYF